MSLIQTVIGSSVSSGDWIYPPPGHNYTENLFSETTGSPTATAGSTAAPAQYYEAASLDTPTLGLWRRTYDGVLITPGVGFVSFGDLTQRQTMKDTKVGFGSDDDRTENFSMTWFGYFKPAVNGNFVFAMNVDDYAYMWVGHDAVIGSGMGNAYLNSDNGADWGQAIPMTANKYYPVRIYYTEIGGGHNCSIWAGLDGEQPKSQEWLSSVGQFYFDNNSKTGTYPVGLVTP